LLGDGGRCNADPPFINCHCFMPDGPHESDFLVGPNHVPNLRPLELVVPWEIALPHVYNMCGSCSHVDNKVCSKLCGIIKKVVPLNPTPLVWDPTKSGCFAVKEDDFFLLLPFGSMNDFSFLGKANHIPSKVFSVLEASIVGSKFQQLSIGLGEA
jgi:hypothetical protein